MIALQTFEGHFYHPRVAKSLKVLIFKGFISAFIYIDHSSAYSFQGTIHFMQKMGRCIKLIMYWSTSSDEKGAGDYAKVFAKIAVKVNLKELDMKKN